MLESLNFEWPEPRSEQETLDSTPVSAALVDRENRLGAALPEADFDRGRWPATPELLDALRAALVDRCGDVVGHHIAYRLVRCGCRQAATLAGLCEWDRQLFRWRELGFSSQDLLARLQAAGVAGEPEAGDLEKLDGWLADPAAVLAYYGVGNLAATLLKGRVFSASLYNNGGEPDYRSWWQGMGRLAGLALCEVVQTALTEGLVEVAGEDLPEELRGVPVFREEEVVWEIGFRLDGQSRSIYVKGDLTWVNERDLSREFDRLLESLGRSERVLRLGGGRTDEESFWGRYLVADPLRFFPMAAELGIPVYRSGQGCCTTPAPG
ncbi:hypothetical protein IV102_01045 [bacterium]|nr:hypothetical protein [bacterium]